MAKPKFEGQLNEPIVVPFEPQPIFDETVTIKPHGLLEQWQKMDLLFEHYGVEKGSWPLLALALAVDLIPGFQLVYDDPLAAFMGFQVKGGEKAAVRMRAGAHPTFTGQRLLAMVDAMKKMGKVKGLWQTDKECALFFLENIWNEAGSRQSSAGRASQLSTIERRIRQARKACLGPVSISRGNTKSV